MERRNFSIEPYVAASGILGDRLEVDGKAADSVMRRTALRRDFSVAKGYFREAREAEGDEVLAISTVRAHNQHERSEAGSSEFADLIRNPDNWVLSVHDQQIGDNVNEWMDKNFKAGNGKSGQEVFAQKFVEGLKREVADGVRSAFWDEKKEIFTYPFKNSKTSLGMLVFGSVVSFGMMRWLYEHNIITGKNANGIEYIEYLLLMSSMAVFFLASTSLLINRLNNPREKGIVGTWSQDLPNPQIPSIVLGRASLLLNSGKLIKLKKD